jgi:hypothetical protein
LPKRAPTPSDLAERDAFAALVNDSLPMIRASAETWRNGLAAFVTLVTAAVAIKGRDTTADLAWQWRLVVASLTFGGLLIAVLGLWQALGAQAGTRAGKQTFHDVQDTYGSVAAYKVSLATTAARRLGIARRAVAVALALILAGICAAWLAPSRTVQPPAALRVDHGGTATCGTLASADGGYMRLQVKGYNDPVAIALTEITNITVVATCN